MKGIVITSLPQMSHALTELPETSCEALSVLVGGVPSVVRPTGLKRPYCFVCNDDFLALGLPLNPVGSRLYGTQHHGHPICGDIVILKEERGPYGTYYLAGLTDEECKALLKTLKDDDGETPGVREEADAT